MSKGRSRAAYATFAGSSATTMLAAAQALVLIPLYLGLIGPRLYGAWLASGELLAFLLVFDMGIPNLMIQRIGAALARGDRRAVGGYFGTGAAVLSAFAMLLIGALFLLAASLPGWLGLSGAEASELRAAFQVGSLATGAMLLNYLFQGLSRGMQQTALVNLAGFLGTLLGFALTLTMLLLGYGLMSLAAGLVMRSGVSLMGGLAYLAFQLDPEIRRSIRLDRTSGREFRRLSPPLFVSGLGNAAMTNSQVFFAGALLGPESAAIFGITRKAAEMAGMVLQAVGHAAYGGFANLFASGDGLRARAVYREIVAIYLAVGLALLCAYVAVNPSLVAVWAGPAMFGGTALTALLALSSLVAGWSYLTIGLYRAMDRHQPASKALLAECALRLPLMIGLTLLLGLPGLPLGALATGLVSGVWAHRRIERELPGETHHSSVPVWALRLSLFGLGLAVCLAGGPPSWGFVLTAGFSAAALSGLALLFFDPLLKRFRGILGRRLAGVRA
jgi:O-antigen/teichoic acid export membrane protein